MISSSPFMYGVFYFTEIICKMLKFLKNIYNELDFFFRKNIRLKRKYTGKNEPKENNLPEKEKLFLEKYNLYTLKENSTCRNYLENLAVIELLESYLYVEESRKSVKILDIGSKNWFYAAGEWHFFKYCNREKEIYLDGIEIDAFRVYSDFHTRYDYAQFYIKNLENTRYITKDFLLHKDGYDYITWFFPFVTEYPLLEWGLPLSVYKPVEMLRHGYNSLNIGGKLLIVNQDEKEYAIQEDLLKKAGFAYERKGEFISSFLEFEHKRLITIVYK